MIPVPLDKAFVFKSLQKCLNSIWTHADNFVSESLKALKDAVAVIWGFIQEMKN